MSGVRPEVWDEMKRAAGFAHRYRRPVRNAARLCITIENQQAQGTANTADTLHGPT